MLPNMDPRTMQMAMKRLGIKQTDIPATEVIIKTEDNDIIITEPVVSKISMPGQESFQITGNISVKGHEQAVSKEDISTVMSHANCTEEQAVTALTSSNGDIAEAILKIKGQ